MADTKLKYTSLTFLHAGEDKNNRIRSDRVVEYSRKGCLGDVLVSGCAGAYDTRIPKESAADIIANYLNVKGVPSNKIFIDGRAFDTLGDIAFPFADPIEGNPTLDGIDILMQITEKAHIKRAYQYALKIIPQSKIYYIDPPEGNYKPGPDVLIYNYAMLKRLRYINEPNPKEALRFLKEEHPFYKPGWFKKSVFEKRLEMAKTILNWLKLDL